MTGEMGILVGSLIVYMILDAIWKYDKERRIEKLEREKMK